MKIILALLFIPFLLSVGHDVYLNYLADDQKIRAFKSFSVRMSDFKASDLGWVWREYAPASFDSARKSMDAETWRTRVDPVLRSSTMTVAATPFVMAAVLTFVYNLLFGNFALNTGSYQRAGGKAKEEKSLMGHSQSKTIKYKKR